MKSFIKFIISVAIIFALVIMGCTFFCPLFESKKDVGLGTSITVFIIGSLAFVAIEVIDIDSKKSIRTEKLTKLNEIADTFKNTTRDKNINKQLEEIHNELEKINKYIEEIKNNTGRNNIDIEEISKKVEEIKGNIESKCSNLLSITPSYEEMEITKANLKSCSDMFKAYVNAVAEI